MARSHLKVYFSFEDDASELTDEEKGRLLLALLRYAKTGEITPLTGNERFLFPVFRAQADRDAENYEIKVSNGSKGGRPTTKGEPKETENNLTKPNETENILNPKTEDRRQKIEDRRQKTEELFPAFWAAYPRKEGKQTALKAFTKINPDQELLQTMLAAIERQKQTAQWKENGGQYIPHPATWLNGRRWEDEVVNRVTVKPGSAQDYEQRDYSNAQAEAMARFVAMNGGAL